MIIKYQETNFIIVLLPTFSYLILHKQLEEVVPQKLFLIAFSRKWLLQFQSRVI